MTLNIGKSEDVRSPLKVVLGNLGNCPNVIVVIKAYRKEGVKTAKRIADICQEKIWDVEQVNEEFKVGKIDNITIRLSCSVPQDRSHPGFVAPRYTR